LRDLITKKVTDELEGNTYRFTFYCDICGQPWHSVDYTGSGDAGDKERDHSAAFERAKIESRTNFNYCVSCERAVCDRCFRVLPDRDICKECSGGMGREIMT
jgi:hypothetical protein